MTLLKRLRSFFVRTSSLSAPSPVTPAPMEASRFPPKPPETESASPTVSFAFPKSQSLPDWLVDDEALRDEGVLFGLSEARPDGKLAQIRAAFAQQSAPTEEFIEQQTEKISEFNLLIEQHENRLATLRNQVTELRISQPVATNLIRTTVSLGLSVLMCVGNFHLIDETLQPSFSNRWVAIGVFLSGMFTLFGRLSFFYETDTPLSGRRIIEEVGLPLAASVFILLQALQTHSVGSAIGLVVFVFFVFLLSGKLLLSTLTSLQNDLTIIQRNNQLIVDKEKNLPVWESELIQIVQQIDFIRTQKWPVVLALNHAQAELNQLNAHRDRLVNVFMSEFELARSLRERLTDQQRKLMMNYE